MSSRTLAVLVVAVCSLGVTACGESNPPPATQSSAQAAPGAPMAAHPPIAPTQAPTQAPAAAPSLAPSFAPSTQLIIQGFAAPVPSDWIRSQPASPMRVAQFAVAPAGAAEAGELVAYFFPSGQGGPHDANIERWASQFVGADGKPVSPKVSTRKAGDTEVTLVELQGTYSRGVGMGPTGDAKPDQSLLSAMVETSIGRITLQMYGPSKTVAAQRNNFLKLAQGFRPA